ncbi:hypothetical protein [Jannaschia sp. R86511]|uniref:hypothetical protein n=1 Tax=Jannaschia sp. R86511 TaxID=3093853 RepID=UPI0036D239DD
MRGARLARPAGLAAVVLVALVTASCTVSGGTSGEAAPSPEDAVTQDTPQDDAGAQGSGEVPDSWTAHEVEGLAFALPDYMQSTADLIPGTVETLRASAAEGEVPAAAGVFVETGDVGPLELRADLIRQVRVDQLGAEPVGEPRVVDVAGAAGAVVLTWEWDYDYPGGPTVASRQVEVVIAVEGEQQYGMLVGGPEDVLTEEVVDDFLASLQVTAAGGQA